MKDFKQAYKILEQDILESGLDVEKIKTALKNQKIETPSWGYANSGTRFGTFACPGAARTLEEKLEDAAMVNTLTGVTPSVALHIPWDKTNNWAGIKDLAKSLGLTIGAINPNIFQDQEYKLGSVCNPKEQVRQKALAHILECVEIMKQTGSKDLSLWFADGTNYAGQDNMAERKIRLEEALANVYKSLATEMRMLIEYKFFEPAFYHTDLPDWGTAYALALKLGTKAEVLVDTGHHAPGTNIEQIVSFLISEGKLGGFHFNSRKYGDDDLIVGSVNPFELFLIFTEIEQAKLNNRPTAKICANNIAYMIDQSHNLEPKIEAMIQSVINCQSSLAKSLLVNYKKLYEAQNNGDILGAHRELTKAFETDVRPLLMQTREEMGIAPDPLIALKQSDYETKIAKDRGTDTSGGSGYPTS